jgi:hypothetical protein
MDSTSLPRLIAYSAASLGSLILITSVIVANWTYAGPVGGNPPSRLRWHMITKNKIAKGTQIKADDVTWTLGRVSKKDPLIPVSRTIVGKYAKNDIEPNSTCVPNLLSDLALADPPLGGVVVPIEVKTSDVSSLKPGMHLAFVQAGKLIQPKTTLLNKQNQPGLLLLSMTVSKKDTAVTTLLVEIGKSDLESAPLLVNGTWRPVILGASEAVSPKPPVPPEVKRKTVRPRVRRKR